VVVTVLTQLTYVNQSQSESFFTGREGASCHIWCPGI